MRDWLIVDFPGFDDSNGKIISLGMECALKALLSKYKPRILVLEPITNIMGGKGKSQNQQNSPQLDFSKIKLPDFRPDVSSLRSSNFSSLRKM